MIENEQVEQPAAPPEEQSAAAPQNENQLRAILAERKILYSQPTSDKVVQILRGGNPVESMAVAAGMVLKAMLDSAKAGIPPDVAGPLRDALFDDLAELANAIGLEVGPEEVEASKQMLAQAGQSMMSRQQPNQQQPQAPAQPQMPQAAPGLLASQMAG